MDYYKNKNTNNKKMMKMNNVNKNKIFKNYDTYIFIIYI